ncbi:MAG: glutathione S-transferase family protein [Myxococcales bacterium]|nr:glutathione S-transferase family protein [Myxococcales bacterium]
MTGTGKLKLYHYPATRSARVKWLLHEILDDDFDVEVVPLYDGVQYGDEYLQKNPNHCVPTLAMPTPDGEQRYVIESGAMVVLLADAYPDKQLAPPPAPLSYERADYLQAIHFASTLADMMLWQIRLHEHLLSSTERDERTIKRYRNKFMREAEPQFKGRLDAHSFACGERFSAADCVVGHDVLWARAYGLCQDDTFTRYVGELFKRPAFEKAFADLSDFSLEVPGDKKQVHSLVTG